MIMRTAIVLASLPVLAAAVVGAMLVARPSLDHYRRNQPPAADRAADELLATFMGTSTILFDDGRTAIMTDGFFSRPSLWKLATRRLEPDECRIREALEKANVRGLDAVLVAHSHHDHAMDSATVVALKGGSLVGSPSTRNVAIGQGKGGIAIVPIEAGRRVAYGAFHVTAFRSPHSPTRLFRFPGDIPENFDSPAWVWDYREGGSYSFLIEHRDGRVLVHPSANHRPAMYAGVRADVVFLGIGQLEKQSDDFVERYWCNVVRQTGADLVIPIHWDDFTRPLVEPLPAMPLLMGDVDEAMERIAWLAQRDNVAMTTMPLFKPVDVLGAASRRSPARPAKVASPCGSVVAPSP